MTASSTSRPAAPGVLGHLSILFGALVLTMQIAGFFSDQLTCDEARAPTGGRVPEQARVAFERFQDTTRVARLVMAAGFIVMSAALIVVGIGQCRYARWGRLGTLIWSVTALLALAGAIALYLLVLKPATEAYLTRLESLPGYGVDELARGLAQWFAVLAPLGRMIAYLLYATYPVVLLCLLGSRRMKDVMVD